LQVPPDPGTRPVITKAFKKLQITKNESARQTVAQHMPKA